MLVVNEHLSIPLREFDFTFSRSAGPGGQNVNKVNSRATLRWDVSRSKHVPDDVRERFLKRFGRRVTKEGEFVLTSQRFRDAGRNVADCLEKLRSMLLEVAAAPTERKKTRATRASREQRLRDKKTTSKKKEMRRRPGYDD